MVKFTSHRLSFARITALACAIVWLGIPTRAHAAATPKCDNLEATIVSSSATINGTTNNDVIVVQGVGKHVVNAGGGNDTICGTPSVDIINSGNGNDKIISGDGNDTITSGEGNDTVNAGPGNDIVNTGPGDDRVNAGAGIDRVTSGTGNDTVAGDAGNDTLSGQDGIDSISGGPGNDSLTGGAGNDRLSGQDGADTLKGDAGDDTLQGGSSPDVLAPGAGSDVCAKDNGDSIVGNCTIDANGPTTSDVNATSRIVAGSTVTFIWTVRDLGGVDLAWVKIGGPSGWVTSWCGFVIEGSRIDSSSAGQTFMAKCAVPAEAVNTTYTAFFSAVDVFGQYSPESTANFEVFGGVADSAAPVVKNLSVSSNSTAGQSITISWDAEDESGVEGIIAWAAYNGYSFASNEGRIYADYALGTLVSGNPSNGKYEQSMTLNPWAPVGTYTIWISARDKFGNKAFFSTGTTFTHS